MTTLSSQKESLFRRLATSFGHLDRLTKIFLVAFLIAGIGTGILAFSYVSQFVRNTPSGVLPGLAIHEDTTLPSGELATPIAGNVYGYAEPAAWDGSSRVNILIMGLDARDWEAGSGAPRTDSMIVLTFDPVTKTAGMLSVPRDLWVDIPGFGYDKINNAYALGEGNRLPGGGPGLAVQTVEQFLGITINYYAQIDFSAFERFIDFIGGVKIDIPHKIRVDIIGQPCTGDALFSGGAQSAPITAEQAGQIAADYLGRTGVWAVKQVSLDGQMVFRVKFDNDDAAFVDQLGVILKIRLASGEEGGPEILNSGDVYVTNGCTLIAAGRQTLNGAYALAYARARHVGDGDFDRSRRQQQVILAIRERLSEEDARAKLINNALQIYDELASGINTNMTVQDALSLGWAAKDVDLSKIEQAVIAPNACDFDGCIGKDFVIIAKSPDGLDILKPVTENIRLLRDKVFASGGARSPLALTSQAVDLMKMEAANVVVNNGSGNSGIAETTRAFLEGQGMIIASTGNADAVNGTTIIDYTGNPYTVQFLASLMNINASHIFSSYDPSSTVDVQLILGSEWVVPQ